MDRQAYRSYFRSTCICLATFVSGFAVSYAVAREGKCHQTPLWPYSSRTFDPNGTIDQVGLRKSDGAAASPIGSTVGAMPPINDMCATATAVPTDTDVFLPPELDILGATSSATEPQESCEFLDASVSNSVWFSYTPFFCGEIAVNSNGSTYDTVLSIFSGTCSTNVEVACDDDGGTLLESQLVSVPLERDMDYLIKVADWGPTPETQDGTLTFNLVALPQRGDFDFDCAVTLADLAPFETCAQGPDEEFPVDDPFGCGLADFDLDGDADLRDFAQLQVQFSIR